MALFRKIEPRKQIHLVIAQINAGDYMAALQACEKLLGKIPRHAEGSRLMGQIWEKLGNDRKAVAYYKIAAEVNPSYANYRSYGHLCRRLGNLDEAVTAFENALEIDHQSVEVTTALAEIYEERSLWPKAVSKRKKILDRDPDDLEALFQLSRCSYRAKLIQEAVILCTRLLNKNPVHAQGLRLLADCMLLRHQQDRALELYQQALHAQPADWEGHYYIATMYLSLEKKDSAIQHFQLCLRHQSTHLQSHRSLIDLYKDSKEWLEAEIVLKHLIVNHGESPELLDELGDLYFAQAQYDSAMTVYQQARSLRTGDNDLDAKFVTAALRAGRAAEVISLAHRLVSNDMFNVHYHYLYALCLLAIGDRAKAIDLVKEVTVSATQHPEFFRLRAALMVESTIPSTPATSVS